MSANDRDPDLEALRHTPVPPADDAAKARAVAAALAAFDAAQADARASAKGLRRSPRLNTDTRLGWWRDVMHSRLTLGSVAAGALLLPLAAVILTRPEPARLDLPRPAAPVPEVADAAPERRAQPAEPARPEPQSAAPSVIVPPFDGEAALELHVAPLPSAASPADKARAPAAPAEMAGAPDALAYQAPAAADRFFGPPPSRAMATAQEPVSTFSIDTDTASYAWLRRSLSDGRIPAPDEVRVEELVNYFPYDYPLPKEASRPFQPTVTVFPTPWNTGTRIVHIGIKGYDVAPATRPAANLVFLIDTSGSMAAPDKLPLVQASLKLLIDRLAPTDRIAIVTYAGAAGVALEPTRVSDRQPILAAIDRLGAGGSTAGAAGIETAYALARQHFDPKAVNRVILATDGDFNVGPSDDETLTRLIERERRSGVFLSVLGFGEGNYNDALMQRLAQNGNGTAAYIDGLDEAQKVLVDEASATLFPIAKDVKIQVEFNPAQVSEYRLIGYETRRLDRADFNNDRVDAGEVGSGTAVTALYEITPAGSPARLTDDLRYGTSPSPAPASPSAQAEYAYLKIRYKLPDEAESRLIEQAIGPGTVVPSLAEASTDVRFATAVAAFGEKLRGSPALAGTSYDAIIEWAEQARGEDRWGYRSGFLRLARLAKSLAGPTP